MIDDGWEVGEFGNVSFVCSSSSFFIQQLLHFCVVRKNGESSPYRVGV